MSEMISIKVVVGKAGSIYKLVTFFTIRSKHISKWIIYMEQTNYSIEK